MRRLPHAAVLLLAAPALVAGPHAAPDGPARVNLGLEDRPVTTRDGAGDATRGHLNLAVGAEV